MLSDLEKIKAIPSAKTTVSIGIPTDFEPAVNFYRDKDSLSWLNTASRDNSIDPRNDYFFFTADGWKAADQEDFKIIRTYPVTQNVLARSADPMTIDIVLSKEIAFDNQHHITTDEQYSPGFDYTLTDSLQPFFYGVIALEAEVMAPDVHKDNLMMIVDFEGPNGTHSWQKAYIKDVIKKKDTWYTFTFTCLTPKTLRARDNLKAYIWNPERGELYVKRMRLRWLNYN